MKPLLILYNLWRVNNSITVQNWRAACWEHCSFRYLSLQPSNFQQKFYILFEIALMKTSSKTSSKLLKNSSNFILDFARPPCSRIALENLAFQMLPDVLDHRQIWTLSRPRPQHLNTLLIQKPSRGGRSMGWSSVLLECMSRLVDMWKADT